MRIHPLNLAASVSTVIAVVIVLLWLEAVVGNINGITPIASFSKDFHITICERGTDARLAFYNDAVYGPYHGSIIGMTAPGHPPTWKEHAFGDTAGIYYRYIRWPGGAVLWTLMISLLYPLGLTLVLPLVWFCKNLRLHRPANNL